MRNFFLVQVFETREESFEHNHNKQGRCGQHEISFSHIVLSILLIQDYVVIVLMRLYRIKVVQQHVLRSFINKQLHI